MFYHFAQPDWESTLLAGRSLVPLLPLDELEAARAAAIFDRLHLPDVPGQPTLGEAAGDWFRDVVRAVFGSIDDATGIRQVPGVFLLVPKKNSKTTNGAALMLTALLMNERPNAAFALFGPTQEIADLAFAAVSGMVAADKDLDTLLHVRDHLKTVVIRTNHPRAQDPAPVEGYFRDEADAKAEADRRLALFGSETRSLYRIVIKAHPFIHEIGETIRVIYPRWDLAAGRDLVIVALTEDTDDNHVELRAWG